MSTEKEFIGINIEKTVQEKGYHPRDLAPTGKQLIWWKCESCGVEQEYKFSYYNKKVNKDMCRKCCHKHRKQAKTGEKPKKPVYPLPPEINREATIEMFGYDPVHFFHNNEKPWSRERLVVNCGTCGSQSTPKRSYLHGYECIKETGHFKCKGCYTRERRTGVKITDATRRKQIEAQRVRREKEEIEKTNPQKREDVHVPTPQNNIDDEKRKEWEKEQKSFPWSNLNFNK